MPICPTCENDLPDDAAFCNRCWSAVDRGRSASPWVEPPPPPASPWVEPPPPTTPWAPPPTALGYGGAPPSAYGTPAGYGPMGGYYAPPAVGTNGLAIASLVCSLAGPFTCGLTTIVGVVLGHVSLSQIKRSQQQGRGMAVAGVVIGYVSIVAGLLFILLAIIGANGSSPG